jgi:hypothetical protein
MRQYPLRRRRFSRKLLAQVSAGAVAVVYSVAVGAWMLRNLPSDPPKLGGTPTVMAVVAKDQQQVFARQVAAKDAPQADAPPVVAKDTRRATPLPGAASQVALAELTLPLGQTPSPLAQDPPLRPSFEPAAPAPAPSVPERPSLASLPPTHEEPVPLPPEKPQPVRATAAVPATTVPAPEEIHAPPAPRRAEIAAPVTHPAPARLPARPLAPQNRTVVARGPAPDRRNFFEKLFGVPDQPREALAYASPEPDRLSMASNRLLGEDRSTAIYDISAHTVYLPDGTRLEAHSGLGNLLDDPRHTNEVNRGATPPHVYELGARTELFHGVQALRLNPVGGDGTIFGRNGILAHTYMLGPRGDSNGCVSFKNYNAFLQAYLRGEIKRIKVVASLN